MPQKQNLIVSKYKNHVDLHRQWLCLFWPEGIYSKTAHKALGNSYVSDSRFKAYYDQLGEDCANFSEMPLIPIVLNSTLYTISPPHNKPKIKRDRTQFCLFLFYSISGSSSLIGSCALSSSSWS